MASEATWADAYRAAGHRETASWHFVDLELDGPNLEQACFGLPPLQGAPASAGPSKDCVTYKLSEFQDELASPSTAPAERLLALKWVLHLVGDIHQPLHAADNHDRGGNCVRVELGDGRSTNLHSYWDTGVLAEIGPDPAAAALYLDRLNEADGEAASKAASVPTLWAQETLGIAVKYAYTLGEPPGCDREAAPLQLSAAYQKTAYRIAKTQLARAGVRLAWVLNDAAQRASFPEPMGQPEPGLADPSGGYGAHPNISAVCSQRADDRGLHGADRKVFREACKRQMGW